MNRHSNGHVYRALTVAGSDCGGGAGIQADLKTFASFGVFGMSVITGLTAQNTLGVQGIESVPPDFVALQLRSVFDDLRPDALKTGMLGSTPVIEQVVEFLKEQKYSNIVVDPVMVAKGGQSLLEKEAVNILREKLLPIARIVTPNIPEAQVLCGYEIDSISTCQRAAHDIARMGPEYVVIKGGHAQESWQLGQREHEESSAVDLVFDHNENTYFSSPRINSKKTHGTGCTFSAAITACLAQGAAPLDCIAAAKWFIYRAIESAQDWDVGMGHGPTNHSVVGEPMFGMVPGKRYKCVSGNGLSSSFERLDPAL